MNNTKIVGDFGEALVVLFLSKVVTPVNWVGFSNYPYDIEIPIPDGRYFTKPTLISVKTRTRERLGYQIPPSKEDIERVRKDFRKWDFWVAYVRYVIDRRSKKDFKLKTICYLINTNKLKFPRDFNLKSPEKEYLILVKSIVEKADYIIKSTSFED
ncbi:MAG: hypothetical protein ACP5LN_10615 [Thermoproteota archaeon]